MRLAIQGEKGSFSHEAALQFMPDAATIHCCALSAEVFECLKTGKADAAVIPIENSLAGSVLEHYDLMLAHPIRIERELLLRIRHQLIAAPGTDLGAVHEVYSHPVALAQCRNFFAAHHHVRALPFYDTAGSVAHAVNAGSKPGSAIAGIASEQAARTYGGEILIANIEDNAENYTRFLLLRLCSAPLNISSLPDKVSVAFAVPNLPGSLVGALNVFAHYGLNLSRLESRPVPGSPWEYVFYADYHLTQQEMPEQLLTELAGVCSFIKELGRYTAAV